jgi:hypothetical protein
MLKELERLAAADFGSVGKGGSVVNSKGASVVEIDENGRFSV